MIINLFRDYAYQKHDVEANQKYNGNLPYSFHLKEVELQAIKYQHLLLPEEIIPAILGAIGHDLIEDARITYNDVLEFVRKAYKEVYFQSNPNFGIKVADIIYACTELRGKNRAERHGKEYFDLLKQDSVATYVKLCDIIANVRFGVFTDSSMVAKYRREYPHLKEELYRESLKEMFEDLAALLNIKQE